MIYLRDPGTSTDDEWTTGDAVEVGVFWAICIAIGALLGLLVT
jgi:hypothetical protein